jgi:outer membrane protein
VRNRISNAKISVLDAGYHLDETRQNLYSEIHQMHNSARNAYDRYISSGKAVLYADDAFNYAQQQFRLGLINFIDFQVSQSNLFSAQSNMVQAKYEYYLRSMILDFYLGEPLGLD